MGRSAQNASLVPGGRCGDVAVGLLAAVRKVRCRGVRRMIGKGPDRAQSGLFARQLVEL